jgi:hypothetical protein
VKEPVDHILRPQLPWRDGANAITECGYDGTKVKTITRDEFQQRLKDFGRQRTAMISCMTCSDTAGRYGTWDDDPRRAIQREVEWECRWRNTNEHGLRLRDELTAIATLIEAHRDEFDALVSGNEQRREWLEKKAAMQSKPKESTKPRLI